MDKSQLPKLQRTVRHVVQNASEAGGAIDSGGFTFATARAEVTRIMGFDKGTLDGQWKKVVKEEVNKALVCHIWRLEVLIGRNRSRRRKKEERHHHQIPSRQPHRRRRKQSNPHQSLDQNPPYPSLNQNPKLSCSMTVTLACQRYTLRQRGQEPHPVERNNHQLRNRGNLQRVLMMMKTR